jgi:hypothetical protein
MPAYEQAAAKRPSTATEMALLDKPLTPREEQFKIQIDSLNRRSDDYRNKFQTLCSHLNVHVRETYKKYEVVENKLLSEMVKSPSKKRWFQFWKK